MAHEQITRFQRVPLTAVMDFDAAKNGVRRSGRQQPGEGVKKMLAGFAKIAGLSLNLCADEARVRKVPEVNEN